VYLYNYIEHLRIQTNNNIESECDSLLSKVINSLQEIRHNGTSGGGTTILVDGLI